MIKKQARYDEALRPLEARAADGTVTRWRYPAIGETLIEVDQPSGEMPLRLAATPDRRRLEIGKAYRIKDEYDAAGRLTALKENGHTLLRQEWSPTGQLRRTRHESTAEHYEYDEDGWLSRFLRTPPDEKGRFQHWREIRFNPEGRPRKVADYQGLDQEMDYDAAGGLRSMMTHRDGKTYGWQIERDPSGQIKIISSSFGNQQYGYDADGRLATLTLNTDGQTATAHWRDGLLRRVHQFDGGERSLAYYEGTSDKAYAGLLKQVNMPNRLALGYRYDDAGRLTEVGVGNRSCMVLRYDDEGRLRGWGYRPVER